MYQKRFVFEVLDHISSHIGKVLLERARRWNGGHSSGTELPRFLVQVEGLSDAIVIKNDILAAFGYIQGNAEILGLGVGPVNLDAVA